MNPISHKQATQLIHRRMDGLLNESQLLSLDEHLRSCDSCRAYAGNMDGLSAHLQNEFHGRWDEKSGPSQNIMDHVMAKARRIPMTNRISSGVRLFAGAATLVVLVFLVNFVVSQLQNTSTSASETETANNPAKAEHRLLAITSEQNGNLDIYTMRADGSDLTNITNNSADDVNPFWSPGGKHIAFMSDRTGFMQILVMDVNGDNVVQLTRDETNYRMQDFDPWSPDGSNLIVLQETSLDEKWLLYVMDADGENKTLLFDQPVNYSALSWAPDGKHIAFISNSLQNPEALGLFVIDMDEKNLIEITEQLERNERLDNFHYDWSGDGQSIFFIAYKHINEGNDQWIVYEANLDGDALLERATSSTPMGDWWNGTSFIRGYDSSTLTWLRSDGTYSTFKPLENCQLVSNPQFGFLAKRSSQGNQIINIDCPNDDMWFYYANSDGTIVKPLLDSPLSVREGYIGNMIWSPDDRFTALTITSPDQTNLYILDVAASMADPSLLPLQVTISDGLLYYSPSWQPVHTPKLADNSIKLQVDPQSCKPASALTSEVQPPNELYGYNLVQGISFVDGDFSYEVWLYCDPSIQPDDQRNLNTIAGLGIFASWKYTGPKQEGHTEYYFAFEQDALAQGGSWEGPIHNASLTAARFGVHLPKLTILQYIQQGIPIPFYAVIYSPIGQKSATFSFRLESTENGLRVVELQATQKQPTSQPTQSASSEILPPIGTGVSNGEWIAFIGGEMIPNPADLTTPTLNYDVYMIHPDGSGLTNLTQFVAHYHNLQWSPNGQSLLFMRENSGRDDVSIMRHFAGLQTGYLEVTPPIVDPDHYGYSWSPDSDKIVFADASNGNYDIYTVYADGRFDPELTQLTNDPAHDAGFVWSPDGSQIAFQRIDGENLSVMVMNADGSNQHEVARGSGQVQLEWSQDGTSIYASSTENNRLECEGCVAKPAIYRIQLDGPSVYQIYFEEDASKVAGWYVYDTPQNRLYFMRINRPVFVEFWGTWFRADGNSVTEIGEMEPDQTCKTTTGNILNEDISPNPRFSVISNFCAGGFDLYLADREATPEKRFIHLFQLPLDTWGQGGDFATLPIQWSPDGRWVIYDDGNGTMYLLDIEKAIQDPDTALTPLIQPTLYTGADGQLYQSSDTISVFDLIWQPKP